MMLMIWRYIMSILITASQHHNQHQENRLTSLRGRMRCRFLIFPLPCVDCAAAAFNRVKVNSILEISIQHKMHANFYDAIYIHTVECSSNAYSRKSEFSYHKTSMAISNLALMMLMLMTILLMLMKSYQAPIAI